MSFRCVYLRWRPVLYLSIQLQNACARTTAHLPTRNIPLRRKRWLFIAIRRISCEKRINSTFWSMTSPWLDTRHLHRLYHTRANISFRIPQIRFIVEFVQCLSPRCPEDCNNKRLSRCKYLKDMTFKNSNQQTSASV